MQQTKLLFSCLPKPLKPRRLLSDQMNRPRCASTHMHLIKNIVCVLTYHMELLKMLIYRTSGNQPLLIADIKLMTWHGPPLALHVCIALAWHLDASSLGGAMCCHRCLCGTYKCNNINLCSDTYANFSNVLLRQVKM